MPSGKSRDRAYRIADQVLAGKRHRGVGKAMFFHTAGRTYGYSNMHYVAVAGGNAFYERKPTPGKNYIPRTVIAEAGPRDSIGASRWPFGSGYAVNPASQGRRGPGRRNRLCRAAAVAARRARLCRGAEPPAPGSIEAIILASNGF